MAARANPQPRFHGQTDGESLEQIRSELSDLQPQEK